VDHRPDNGICGPADLNAYFDTTETALNARQKG
jgi:hypothetical protein